MNTTHHITAQQLAFDADLTIHTMPSMASMIELLDIGSEDDAYVEDDAMLSEDLQAYEALLRDQIEDL